MKTSIHKIVILVFLFFFSLNSNAQSAGFNTTFVILSVNGGGNTYYDLLAATTNPDFNGNFLGSFCEGTSGLVFKGAEHNNYKCGGCDITGTKLMYNIHPTASTSGTFVSNVIGYTSGFANGCGGADQKWSTVGYSTDLLSGLSAGDYTIEIYSEQSTSCSGNQYSSNGGLNYKATFTVVAASVAGSVSSNQIICSGSTPSDITLTGNVGSIQWQSSNDNISFSNISGANSSTLLGSTIGALSSTRYFRAVVTNSFCSSVNSATVTVSMGGTTTWTGTSWNNGTPNSASNAIIGANYSESANIEACTLTVNNNAVVVIPSGFDVSLFGALTVTSGSLTFNNNANLIQSSNASNSGNITFKRNSSALKRLDFTMWSSPVSGSQTLASFSPLTDTDRFYVYNSSTNEYNAVVASSTTFADANGYLIRMPNNHPTWATTWEGSFVGNPNNGNKSFSMVNGFNAVGNPYPSRLNVHNFIDANTTITGTLYFWRKTNNSLQTSYATLTKLAYVANSAPGGDTGAGFFTAGNEANWVVNAGQGFIVKATSASSLNFTNSMRRSSNDNQFFKVAQNNAKTNEAPSLFKLNMTNLTDTFCQMAVGYTNEATLGFDRGIDGQNMNPEFYITSLIGNDEYAIQGRPSFENTDIVPLSYKVASAGDYTISLDTATGLFGNGSQSIYLKDNLANTTTDLTLGNYTFNTLGGVFTNRFEIVYQSTLSSNQSVSNLMNVLVYKNQNDIIVNAGTKLIKNVTIYDVRGRMLKEITNANQSEVKVNANFSNEVLLIHITNNDGEVVVKKLIN